MAVAELCCVVVPFPSRVDCSLNRHLMSSSRTFDGDCSGAGLGLAPTRLEHGMGKKPTENETLMKLLEMLLSPST